MPDGQVRQAFESVILEHPVGRQDVSFAPVGSLAIAAGVVNPPAGVAWPLRIYCDGSPLPQNGVPSTWTVSALPTRARLRQNPALMPR